MAPQTVTIGHLTSLFTQDPDPIFLLGAGASLKSGIPLADKMVERIARYGYCKDNSRSPEDPHIQDSDWQPWLKKQNWYQKNLAPEDNYPFAVENILRPEAVRKEFFLDILNTHGQPPSKGYEHIVELMAQKLVRTVLTTNFDTILWDLCKDNPRLRHVNAIQTESDYTKFSTSPQHPQIIYLHGSVEHYTDKNTIGEINEELHPNLISMLKPLLRDHPLIVIGYRGAEPSVMKHLFIKYAKAADNYRHGIYWCSLDYDEKSSDSMAPFVHKFAAQIQRNFQVVHIGGFDEVMDDLSKHIHQRQSDYDQPQIPAVTEASRSLKYNEKTIQSESTSHVENSQIAEHQILNRIEERSNALCATDEPNLTVLVKPVSSYHPLISTTVIYEVAKKDLAPVVEQSALKRVAGGTCFLIGGEKPYNCLELNEHGIVYYRQDVQFGIKEKHIFLSRIAWAIGFAIKYARSLYERCESLGELEITAQLREVLDEQLRFHESQRYHEWRRQQSLDSEIHASIQCFPRDLVEKEKNIYLVDDLVGQLLWAFNVNSPEKRRELIEDLLKANNLLPT